MVLGSLLLSALMRSCSLMACSMRALGAVGRAGLFAAAGFAAPAGFAGPWGLSSQPIRSIAAKVKSMGRIAAPIEVEKMDVDDDDNSEARISCKGMMHGLCRYVDHL